VADNDTLAVSDGNPDADVKQTAYGYPGDATPDWNSEHGIGDAGWANRGGDHLVPQYSAALTVSERADRFPGMNPDTSTGYEFTFKGKTYRDDDTAPEADKRVDVYDPSHPPDTFHYSANISGKEPQELPPIEQMRADYPELASYSDDQILSELKPKVAPNMSDDDFKKAAYDPDGAETFRKQADQMSLMQKARLDFPQYAQLNDDDFTKRVYGLLSKSGQIDPKVTSLDTFKNQLTPPNPVITWLQNTFKQVSDFVTTPGAADDPWTGVAKDYGKMFERAQGTLHESAAGLYGAPQGLANLGESPLAILDAVAKQAGIDSQVQKGYDQFTQKYLQTPFDDFFRKSLHMLNAASNAQRLAAQAHMEKAKDLNPVLAVTADIAGSLPEMTATFGVGAAAKGATKAELVGRALWATMYQASAANGKATDATSTQRFLNQYRAGMSTALLQKLFSSPYGRLSTGLMGLILQADVPDIMNWIEGKPSHIGDTAVSMAVNFGLAYMWGHDNVSEAAQSDVDAAETLRLSGNIKNSTELFDRAFTVMPEEEAHQHAQNYVTLLDILSDNSLHPGNILETKEHKALTPETLKKQVDNAQRGTPSQIADKMAAIKPGKSVYLNLPEPEEPAPYHPWNKPLLEGAFAEAVTGKKAGPLRKTDVQRFTGKYYFNRDRLNRASSQRGAILNPGVLVLEAKKAVQESEFVRGVSAIGSMESTPKGKEAAAQIGQIHNWASYESASFANDLFRQEAEERFLNDMDTSKKRAALYWKYPKEQQQAIIIAHEKGEESGDPVLDEIRRVHKIGYGMMAQDENERGETFNIRDNYIVHAIKNREAREVFIKRMSPKFADPDYMHPRELESLEQAAMLGHEFETNEEELFQGRVFDHYRTKAKSDALDLFESEGNAYKTDAKDIPEEAKEWEKIRSPKRKPGTNIGTTYYVHPEKSALMARAWDPMFNQSREGRFADMTVGNFIRMLKAVKGVTTPIRLFSAAHLAHIPTIRIGSRFAALIRDATFADREMTPADWFKALSDIPTSGVQQIVRDVRKYQNLVKALQGDAEAKANLTDTEKRDFVQLLDGGYSPGFNHDQHAALVKWFNEVLPTKLKQSGQWDTFTKFGHELASHTNFQEYTFGTIIPSVKAAHALERVAELYKARPELMDEKNNVQRLMALRKIMRQTDLRLGEMNYDQVFMPKFLKGLGVGTFLSFAWQLGLVDYAGGLIDVGKNSVHFAKVLAETKNMPQAARALLQDRMVTAYLYTGVAMTTGAIVTYLNMRTKPGGDQHKFGFRDFFFPWSGRNADGTDNRYRTMTFPGELYSIWHDVAREGTIGGIEHVLGNKYNSTISAVVGAMNNTNFIGQRISDADIATLQGAWDRTAYVLSQSFQPIGAEQYAKPFQEAMEGKPAAEVAASTQDAIAAFFGFNKAPLWTGRTDLANQILQARQQERGRTEGESVHMQKQWDARDNLRTAFQQGDHKSIEAGIKQALQAGLTKKQIELTYKNRKVSTDKLAFKAMPSKDQLTWMRKMSREDLKEYWPFAHHDARRLFNERRTQPAHP